MVALTRPRTPRSPARLRPGRHGPGGLNVAPWDPAGGAQVVGVLRTRSADLVHTHGTRPRTSSAQPPRPGCGYRRSTLHHIHAPARRPRRPAPAGREASAWPASQFMTHTIATSALQRDWYHQGRRFDEQGCRSSRTARPTRVSGRRRGRGSGASSGSAPDEVDHPVSVAPMRRGQGQNML
ncbi:hypothetical protein HBB16_16250 [Pseudonocardia sp. MCCB 268]|nr:hypothetical protein [Pseudonocardia cytotoxica]